MRSETAEPRRADSQRVRESYANGDRYKGEALLLDGELLKHGIGTYHFANGSVYTGSWVMGLMEGHGEFADGPAGDRFCGSWARGRRVCGQQQFGNGDMYIGSFDQDTGTKRCGRAVVIEKSVIFEAFFVDDVEVHREPFCFTSDPRQVAEDVKLAALCRAQTLRSQQEPRSRHDKRFEVALQYLRQKKKKISDVDDDEKENQTGPHAAKSLTKTSRAPQGTARLRAADSFTSMSTQDLKFALRYYPKTSTS